MKKNGELFTRKGMQLEIVNAVKLCKAPAVCRRNNRDKRIGASSPRELTCLEGSTWAVKEKCWGRGSVGQEVLTCVERGSVCKAMAGLEGRLWLGRM